MIKIVRGPNLRIKAKHHLSAVTEATASLCSLSMFFTEHPTQHSFIKEAMQAYILSVLRLQIFWSVRKKIVMKQICK